MIARCRFTRRCKQNLTCCENKIIDRKIKGRIGELQQVTMLVRNAQLRFLTLCTNHVGRLMGVKKFMYQLPRCGGKQKHLE